MGVIKQRCRYGHLKNKTYAAPEPCRRQRPERSEDAAREQAAEERVAKKFRPKIY